MGQAVLRNFATCVVGTQKKEGTGKSGGGSCLEASNSIKFAVKQGSLEPIGSQYGI